MGHESSLVWKVVKQRGEGWLEAERIEDRVATGRPDVLWCVRNQASLWGRLELKYLKVTHEVRWYGYDVEPRGGKLLKATGYSKHELSGPQVTEMSLPFPRNRGLAPGLRLDQALHLMQWASIGVRCGCLLRLDTPLTTVWLMWRAPSPPRTHLDPLHPVQWAKQVVSREALDLVSDSHEGHLTPPVLWRFLIPDVDRSWQRGSLLSQSPATL